MYELQQIPQGSFPYRLVLPTRAEQSNSELSDEHLVPMLYSTESYGEPSLAHLTCALCGSIRVTPISVVIDVAAEYQPTFQVRIALRPGGPRTPEPSLDAISYVRGATLRVDFTCEGGHQFSLSLGQHEGFTVAQVE